MATLFSQEQHGHLVPYIAALHASCITADHMAGPFVPPLKHDKLLAWWKERIAEANRGARVIVILFAPATTTTPTPSGSSIRGVAMLKLDDTETGPFRAEMDALLVQQSARRQGCARTLVAALEAEATKKGRSLLVWTHMPPMGMTCPRLTPPARPRRVGQHRRKGVCSFWIHRNRAGAAVQPVPS